MKILKTAQAEMSSLISERKATATLTRNVRFAVNKSWKPNDKDLIYGEHFQQ